MPKIPGVNCEEAVRAFKKLGYRIVRQGKHVILPVGVTRLGIPRHNPVNAFTMGAIARDAGLTRDEFPKTPLKGPGSGALPGGEVSHRQAVKGGVGGAGQRGLPNRPPPPDPLDAPIPAA